MDLSVARKKLQERHQWLVNLRNQQQQVPEREGGDFFDRVGNVTYGIAKNIGINHLDKLILENEAAQARIRDGTYGKCQARGAHHDIDDERLEAVPEAKYCCAHSPQQEHAVTTRKRPVKGGRKSIQKLNLKVNKAVC